MTTHRAAAWSTWSHIAPPVSGSSIDTDTEPSARTNIHTASAHIVSRVVGAAKAMYRRIICIP
ncbi:hypothetical protein STENM36S_08990 [Streptomyces tendae]